MSSTLELINAIASGDAVATETAFKTAMSEKVSAKLDDMRISVAKGMFGSVVEEEVETITQEEYEALSEEEKAEYELVEGALVKAVNKVAGAVGEVGKAAGTVVGKAVGGVAKTVGAVRQAPAATGAAYTKGRVGAQNTIAGK